MPSYVLILNFKPKFSKMKNLFAGFIGLILGFAAAHFIFKPKGKNVAEKQISYSILTTRGISRAEAAEMINNYQSSNFRIKQFIGYDSNEAHPRRPVPVNAYNFSQPLLNYIVKYQDSIDGLRVYLCKHVPHPPNDTASTYGFVVVGTKYNPKTKLSDDWFPSLQKQAIGETGIFEWNDPCPPYCPGGGTW